MSLDETVQRLRNDLDNLLAWVRPMPGGIQVLGNVERVESGVEYDGGIPIYLQTPLTSTAWYGDAHSTTAKTLIDLSAVFGVPAGVKAVKVNLIARDSASAAATVTCFFGVSPNDTNLSMAVCARAAGKTNDALTGASDWCPCDANGDVYYQINASGASTLDAWIEIWGWIL